MFGKWYRDTGDAPQEANWEGWTPPWMGHEGPGPRGPFGPGHGFGGPWHWHGPRRFFGHWHGFGGPRGYWRAPDELLALRAEAMEVARLFAIASRGAFENKERLSQLRAFLERSRKELSEMIYGPAQGQASKEGQSASGSGNVEQA
jgi:hypothetical protein